MPESQGIQHWENQKLRELTGPSLGLKRLENGKRTSRYPETLRQRDPSWITAPLCQATEHVSHARWENKTSSWAPCGVFHFKGNFSREDMETEINIWCLGHCSRGLDQLILRTFFSWLMFVLCSANNPRNSGMALILNNKLKNDNDIIRFRRQSWSSARS